jgi:hypothetical protein
MPSFDRPRNNSGDAAGREGISHRPASHKVFAALQPAPKSKAENLYNWEYAGEKIHRSISFDGNFQLSPVVGVTRSQRPGTYQVKGKNILSTVWKGGVGSKILLNGKPAEGNEHWPHIKKYHSWVVDFLTSTGAGPKIPESAVDPKQYLMPAREKLRPYGVLPLISSYLTKLTLKLIRLGYLTPRVREFVNLLPRLGTGVTELDMLRK